MDRFDQLKNKAKKQQVYMWNLDMFVIVMPKRIHSLCNLKQEVVLVKIANIDDEDLLPVFFKTIYQICNV